MNDPFVGSLTFCASIPARWSSGDARPELGQGQEGAIGRMLLMHANSREDIKEAYAGDIVALAGLKDTTTGDTLCDPRSKPIILERMEFPEPVIEWRWSRSRRPTRKRWASRTGASRRGPVLPRVDRSESRARPSSRGWANSTSKSSSTACA
jgi:hypothetical protein